MLLELTIENLALVQKTTLSFDNGFTVITGESGAGKSLLILALKLLMGGKPRAEYVRTGQSQATIQAALDWPDDETAFLSELGIETDENLVVRRVISAAGKSRNYVNGVIVPQQTLQTLMPRLISLAGQHEFQGLLSENNHLIWIDRFAGIEKNQQAFSQLLYEYKQLVTALNEAHKAQEKAFERKKRLQKEIADIDAINPKIDEEDGLIQEIKVLKEVTTLRQLADEIYERLYAKKGAVLESVATMRNNLEKMSSLDQRIAPLFEPLSSSFYQLEEVAEGIRRYLATLPTDMSRIEEIEARLYAIKELKRYFATEIEEILQYRKKAEEELLQLENMTQEQTQLVTTLKEKEQGLITLGMRLSEMRKEAAKRLTEAVREELSKLKLMKAGFEVEVTTRELLANKASATGFDEARFLFTANTGEPLRPLASIASGGELSRVMLAVKTALAKTTKVETMIFDEIDSGLGGELAECVGLELKQLAKDAQVIAITHFPQIASLSDHHITVLKYADEGSTKSQAVILKDFDAKEAEIIRMLGNSTESAREYARFLLSKK